MAIVGVVALVVAVVAWLVGGRGADGEADAAPAVRVSTAVADVRDLDVTLTVLGTVDARPGHEAQLAAPAQTRVHRIYAAIGDRVAAGQPLVALDESVWATQTEEARAAMLAARQAHERAERLVREGVAPRKDEESAAATLAQARAALAEAERRQRLGVLRSPIAGVVTAMRAHLGQAVDVNEPLVEVVDPSGLEVLFHLAPGDAARVRIGASVRLTSGPEAGGDPMGDGVVRGVSAAVDSTTGSVEVRATVSVPRRPLRIGESITGAITLERLPQAVVVPASALVPSPEGRALVYVVDDAGAAHATAVVTGARAGDAVQILEGLQGGETVVTQGAYGLTDSARVVRAPTP